MNNLSNSYPLYVTTGVRGLLTEKTSAVLTLGYVNGFYSNGASTSGFLGNTYLDLAFTARLTQLSRAVLGFRHDFINTVISNFAYQETAYASYVQQIAGRLALDLSAGTLPVVPREDRRPDRRGAASTTTSSSGRPSTTSSATGPTWALGTRSSTTSATIPNDKYLKQQVFARLGVTY